MPVQLTETAISKVARDVAASGKRRDLADAKCAGLRLRLSPKGMKSWSLACRDTHGRMRRFSLGAYPAIGISAAREAARALHHRVKHEGSDPIAEARRRRTAAADAGATLAGLLDRYGEARGNGQRTWGESRKRIEVVFRPLLNLPLSTLRLNDLQSVIDQYAFPKSAAFATRTIRPALKWAAHSGREFIPRMLTEITAPVTVLRRNRVLRQDELGRLLPVLRRGVQRPHCAALLWMLLTLCRRSEAVAARWCDIDWQARLWSIPRTKSGRPHEVPLAGQAIELLRSIRPADAESNDLIFQARTHGEHAGSPLSNWDRQTKSIQAASHTAGWTRHDLRRTSATLLGEMGVLPDIVEASLNHASIHSALAATYNRSRYRPQVAAALQKLADELDSIGANS